MLHYYSPNLFNTILMKDNMMDIDYVANLARLEIQDDEKPKFKEQLANILDHFEQLSQIDTQNIEPLAHPFPIYNVWQDDEETPPLPVETALKNAPQTKDNQVVVPKVVE